MSFKKHGLFRHETTFLLAELNEALEIGIAYSHRICSEATFNNSCDLKSYMYGFEGTLRHFREHLGLYMHIMHTKPHQYRVVESANDTQTCRFSFNRMTYTDMVDYKMNHDVDSERIFVLAQIDRHFKMSGNPLYFAANNHPDQKFSLMVEAGIMAAQTYWDYCVQELVHGNGIDDIVDMCVLANFSYTPERCQSSVEGVQRWLQRNISDYRLK